MGTPAYMSPDQARDAKVADTRDDIYSLGASFYECLTGEPPFQAKRLQHHERAADQALADPSALRRDISRSADLICRKMMAKSRDLRYADARACCRICITLRLMVTGGSTGSKRPASIRMPSRPTSRK